MNNIVVFDFEVFSHDILLGALIVANDKVDAVQLWNVKDIAQFYELHKTDFWIGHNNESYDNLILEGCTFTEAKKIFSSIEEIQSITKRTDDFSAPSKKAVGLCIHVNGTAEIRDKIFKLIVKNKLIPYEITTVKNSLEDIFHILTQKNSSQEN